jgi:cytochrome d ubiquinol oxidase subunit II
MPREILAAALALFAVIAYALFGGADFGGGVWDLVARGPRARAQRDAIAHAMGPVWEANHVWLIFLLVILFTAFPPAFAALSIGMFLPFHVVLVGITLRGAAFVFRAIERGDTRGRRLWGSAFGAASVMTPLVLGACLGAVSSGTQVASALPVAMGLLALATCAYLAAVYLTNETGGELREDFRARALVSGTAVVILSAVVLPLTRVTAPHLWSGLLAPRCAPLLALGVAAALTSGGAIRARRYLLARVAAAAQVLFLLLGWGVAQYPYLLFPAWTLSAAAAPRATIDFVLFTLPIAVLVVFPSIVFLFRVFKSAWKNE